MMSWRGVRNGLQTVHLWAGLILSIPFILLGLSGSILMLQPEEQLWQMPRAPGTIGNGGERQSVEAILAAAKTALPGATATQIRLPIYPGEPATVRFEPRDAEPGGNYRGDLVFVDPVTLAVLGQMERPRPARIFGTMRTLHATLYIRTMSDRAFVGFMGIALIFICISGIILWWPRKGQWKNAFWIKEGTRGFRFHRDWHNAIGFWSFLVLFLVSFTGLYLAFPRTFKEGVGMVMPLGQTFYEPGIGATGAPRDLDAALALAMSVVDDVEPRSLQMPMREGGVMVITFVPTGYGAGAPEITVSTDPQTGTIAYVDDPRLYASGERVVVWQRWLHSGLGLGLAFRVLVFLSGLVPLFLAITGVWMWALKRKARARTNAESLAVPAQ